MLHEKFIQYMSQNNFSAKGKNILLAVSGGVDSMVLLHLCKEAKINFAVAHCNFRLRGEESQRDEIFVTDYCKKNNIPFHSICFDTKSEAEKNKTSLEETCRMLRYRWFEELLEKLKFDFLFTAHHADDNVETVLMNFCRGTGLKGVRGIVFKNKKNIRPLLFATRNEIEQFASENNIPFISDSSNADIIFTRNYFRHKIIPALQTKFPQVKNNILQNIEHFTDVEKIYYKQIEQLKKKIATKEKENVLISIGKLFHQPAYKTILLEIVKDYDFAATQLDEIVKLLTAETGKYIANEKFRIIRHQKNLIIAPIQNLQSSIYLLEQEQREIQLPEGKITATILKNHQQPTSDNNIAWLNGSKIKFPIIIRKWKQGDYFYPLGMRKKKKLSRFFIDKKFSTLQKENCYVAEMDKKIIWIVGHRIDERFKIDDNTTEILKLIFIPQ